jgi:hypothetical protein
MIEDPRAFSGTCVIGEVPAGLQLDSTLARLMWEEKQRLGHPLTLDETKAVIEQRASLN